MNTNIKIFVTVIVLLIVGTIATVIIRERDSKLPVAPGKYDKFAQCIKDSGTTFYGAFWCPHCQAQKKLFGTSAKFLPYVECSTPSGTDTTQICKDKKVESYPTWELKDGTRLPVENSAGVTLETLAVKTKCELPVEATQ